MTSVLTFFVTWIVFIALLVFLSSLDWGRTIVYYALWLLLVLLIATHAEELTSMINTKALDLNG